MRFLISHFSSVKVVQKRTISTFYAGYFQHSIATTLNDSKYSDCKSSYLYNLYICNCNVIVDIYMSFTCCLFLWIETCTNRLVVWHSNSNFSYKVKNTGVHVLHVHLPPICYAQYRYTNNWGHTLELFVRYVQETQTF